VSKFNQSNLFRALRGGLLAASLAVLAGCGQQPAQMAGEIYDPYEAENREVHAFNKSVDRALLRPAGKGYTAVVPDDIETLISRFSFNLSIPRSVVNNALKGDMRSATEDFYRFTVNSTLGLGGFFDPATELNMPGASDADFGQTLHAWGVPQGAYIELPIFGPSSERDAAGRFVDFFTNPLEYIIPTPESYYVTGASIASRVGERGRFADTFDSILYDSADSYAQARSLYLQNRNFELGGASNDDYLDPYDDPYDQ
jgi:phospholipid-binding lipoprotein MlaA